MSGFDILNTVWINQIGLRARASCAIGGSVMMMTDLLDDDLCAEVESS